MTNNASHNYLQIYEQTLLDLQDRPLDLVLAHRAVLALARAGALDLAMSEFRRYGLDTVTDHEDIMALAGRLLKDRGLRTSGAQRQKIFRRSSALYRKAYDETQGYYSGINSITMAVLADDTPKDLDSDIQGVIDHLPNLSRADQHQTYFIRATLAEAELLRGNVSVAARHLRNAVEHDPLNYTAHASTLRQFRLILEEHGRDTDWLAAFTPPKAIHFAGHIFGLPGSAAENQLTGAQVQALQMDISDTIQRTDIGFGYGALAAGADILIAETLLEEGAELNVVLPVDVPRFKSISVTPFGQRWTDGFDTCLKRASSVRIIDSGAEWPGGPVAEYADQVAMGLASMRAGTLATSAAQILIWDGQGAANAIGTGRDADLWSMTDREQFILPYPGKRHPPKPSSGRKHKDKLAATVSSGETRKTFTTTLEAAQFAMAHVGKNPEKRCAGGHYGPVSKDDSKNFEVSVAAKDKALPGTVCVSENFAAIITAFSAGHFEADFVGISDRGDRLFNLRPIGRSEAS